VKNHSLKFKLSLSYALVALLLVAAISLFSNVFLQEQFKDYIIRQQNAKNQAAAARVAQLYNADTGTFDAAGLENIGMDALENGLILKVADASGAVVWDAMAHNGGLCLQMLQNMADSMQSRYKNFEGEYEEKTYPVAVGDANVGRISVGYYGPFYYSENDALFLGTLNNVLLIVGVLSLILAVLVGLYMARRISGPIAQAVSAAGRIASGDYTAKISDKTGTSEIRQLIDAVNSLSVRLAEQDALRKRLTADVAHELRTPLSSLQGHLEAFLDNVWPPDRENLTNCHGEVLRLGRLVGDLERLANLEDGSARLDATEFDIKQFAEGVALTFRPACQEKHIHIHVQGESALVRADSDKLRQVFVNLISNSLRYTSEDGHILIQVSQADGWIRILVEDDGGGIAGEHLPHIFERFYRADVSRSSRSGGAGIGLAIAWAIIEMHSGHIRAESEPGRYTRFIIELPAA